MMCCITRFGTAIGAERSSGLKRVLMIAYHFPPLAGSSGIQRTLRFVQHLPSFGWRPIVLTAQPFAYEHSRSDLLRDVPADLVMRRAFALDAARHMQIAGRYAEWMALPDRWISWKFDGVRQGLQLIKQFQPQIIWSTFPIATAHLIALSLHRKTHIPWIADFRDPMAQEDYPENIRLRSRLWKIEADIAARARYCVFTTSAAARQYNHRYCKKGAPSAVLENGYDEQVFRDVASQRKNRSVQLLNRPLVLLHSGIIYPSERNPEKLFRAIADLKLLGLITPDKLRVRFRAAGHEDLLHRMANDCGVQPFVEWLPAISYNAAIEEMLSADGLLILQGSNCNTQVPAKLYEYLRTGRPVIALTDSSGATAEVMRAAGLERIASLDSTEEIARVVSGWLKDVKSGNLEKPDPMVVVSASRLGRTKELVDLLERAS